LICICNKRLFSTANAHRGHRKLCCYNYGKELFYYYLISLLHSGERWCLNPLFKQGSSWCTFVIKWNQFYWDWQTLFWILLGCNCHCSPSGNSDEEESFVSLCDQYNCLRAVIPLYKASSDRCQCKGNLMREGCFVWRCEAKQCCYLVVSEHRDFKSRYSHEIHKNNNCFSPRGDPNPSPRHSTMIWTELTYAFNTVFNFSTDPTNCVRIHWSVFLQVTFNFWQVLAGISVRQWGRCMGEMVRQVLTWYSTHRL
jgi:hypothetical protein